MALLSEVSQSVRADIADSESAFRRSLKQADLDVSRFAAGGDSRARTHPRLNETHRAREFYHTYRQYVFTAINHIAKRCASQPINVAVPERKRTRTRRNTKDAPSSVKAGASLGHNQPLEILDDHPMIDLMDCPNQVQSRWDFTYVSIANYFLTGVCYWIKAINDDGDLEIWAVPTTWIEPVHDEHLFSAFWLRTNEMEDGVLLDPDAVSRTYLPDPSDLKSVLPHVWTQMMSIHADHHLQTSQKVTYENGIWPNMAVKVGRVGGRPDAPRRQLKGEQRRELLAAVRKTVGGVAHYGDPLILDNLIEEVFPLTRTPREMDWLQSGEMLRKRIFHSFGLNPISVGEIVGSNRAQAVVAEKQQCINVLNPVLEQFSVSLTTTVAPLFTNMERGQLISWWEPCIAMDEELHIRKLSDGLKSGALTAAEWRERALGIIDRDGETPNTLMSNPQVFNSAIRLLELVGDGKVDEQSATALLEMFLGGSPMRPGGRRSRLSGRKGNGRISRQAMIEHRNQLAESLEGEAAELMARFFQVSD